MFLRAALLIMILISGGLTSAGELQIPGLEKKTYKLKSMTKDRGQKKIESKADRAKFCGLVIKPEVRVSEGKPMLELNSGLGFEWHETEQAPAEMSDGCRYSVSQKIESAHKRSSLVLINGEECKDGKSVVGSQRDTLQLNGDEIIYQVESVLKDKAGQWQTDEAKEGFTCIWTAVKN